MKIGIDAGALDKSITSGNYRLTDNLIKNFGDIDKENQYFLYSQCPINLDILNKYTANFKNVIVKPKRFWMQLGLSLELFLHPVDVFLGINQALPLLTRCKTVVCVLDIAYKKYPNLFIKSNKLDWQTRKAVYKADRIIAISKSTKKDIVEYYGIDKKRIEVIYL